MEHPKPYSKNKGGVMILNEVQFWTWKKNAEKIEDVSDFDLTDTVMDAKFYRDKDSKVFKVTTSRAMLSCDYNLETFYYVSEV